MATNRWNVAERREDLSRFIVHLTRDDRRDFKNGQSARRNFQSIYRQKVIRAYQAHCLHRHKLGNVPAHVTRAFNVTCFTEVPLNQIHLLTQPIEGRRTQMAPYGFVFRKNFLVQQGAQPAIYINSYGQNTVVTQAVNRILGEARRAHFRNEIWRVLPFVNAMHESYDFTWEREWRIAGALRFERKDLVCVILPMAGENQLKRRLARSGVAVISPGWIYEQIVSELARQQRRTRQLLRELRAKG